MKKIKILIALTIFSIVFINLLPANAASNDIHVGTNVQNSVYTLSETVIDEETNKVAYQKISYSKNTYQTMLCTKLDAAGSSIEVSDDAQYVFLPARYLKLTDNTSLSIKYKNTGVEKIYLHAEYNAGISKGGVDYNGGITFVCVNVLSTDTNEAWNVTQSKSVDGYDVATILFGNYTKAINDFLLTGFRLYFDYGNAVSEERSFEIYGYEVHEQGQVVNFTSDPRPTRYAKLTSEDVEIKNNSFTVNDSATVSAKILEFRPEAYKTSISFNLSDSANIDFKLDDVSVLNKTYGKGSHIVTFDLNAESYSKLDMVFTGNVDVKITKMEFKSPASIDTLSGSGYTITEEDGVLTAKYNYIKSWNSLKGAIRNYNDDYKYLYLEFTIDSPIVLGVYVNDAAIRSHYEYSDPLTVGEHKLTLDVTEFDLLDGELRIYLDGGEPDANNNVGPEKTIVFNKVQLLRDIDLPKSEITVDEKFEFDYDGLAHGASGATVTPALALTYEYKLAGTDDSEYTTTKPANAGIYTVRVSSPFAEIAGNVYGVTYAYSTLIINKANTSKPTANDVELNFDNNTIGYDDEVFIVSTDEDFTKIIKNGGYIGNATKLYVKYFESENYNESETFEYVLPKEEKFNVNIDYVSEKTVEVVPSTVEYSNDGINWISGIGETIEIEPNIIYIFRTKSTVSSFASESTYLSVTRPVVEASLLELDKTRATSITMVPVEGAEYRLADGNWQDSNVFENLTYKDLEEVLMRIKAKDGSYASIEISIIIEVGRGVNRPAQLVELPTDENIEQKPIETPEENPTEGDSNIDDSEEIQTLPEHTFVATTYAELKSAVNGSNAYLTTVYVKGEIVLIGDLTINGKVHLIGEENASIRFENGTDKNTIYNSVNSEITFENIKMVRTIYDNTEGYLFRLHSNGLVWFINCEFDVVTLPSYDQQFDRVTYVPGGGKVTVYFDNCEFNTEACFYRGTLVLLNSDADKLPVTGGSAVVCDFRKFKVDMVAHTLSFQGKIEVSTEEDFSILFESGSVFEPNTTYYITDGTNVVTYTTPDVQLETPTIEDVLIDYKNETISFESKYLVSKNAEFTDLVTSGSSVVPGVTLYIKEVATGIYMDSEVAIITIPSRPTTPNLVSVYECTFGFVMEYYPNAKYKIDGEYQSSPVFVGLESGKTYTITICLEATESSFASEPYQVQVTLK